jgi:hypothetical protein
MCRYRQRSHWINIAREFPGTSIWVIVFDTPYDVSDPPPSQPTKLDLLVRSVLLVCNDVGVFYRSAIKMLRLKAVTTGTSHPTIKDPVQGLSVLARFSSDFESPSSSEGYDRLVLLKPQEQSQTYDSNDIASILQRLRNSTPVSQSHFVPVRGGFGRRSAGRGNSPWTLSKLSAKGQVQSSAFCHDAMPVAVEGMTPRVNESNHLDQGTHCTSENSNWNCPGSGSAQDPFTIS